MTKIKQEIIDRILETARIEEVVLDCLGSYDRDNRGGLKKVGNGIRYTAICPFHNDHHYGNFMVYPKGNCFKCFTCGAKGGTVDFLMQHEKLSYPDAIRWLGKKYNIPTDMQEFNYTPPPKRELPPPLPTLCLPEKMVFERERTEGDPLVTWIRQQNWDYVASRRVDQMLESYHIGHARNGMTIFWQIDDIGKVRTGKMMLYKADGHRDRAARYGFDWIHSALARRRYESDPYPHPELYNPDTQECRPCYFGLHLIDHYGKDATVCLVESEKTALLMAIQYGNHSRQVWMACGGLENLSREKMKPIMDRHRRVVLYPDRDGIEKWRVKMEQLHYDNITIDTDLVTKYWKPEDGEKADIADVVMRFVRESKPMKTLGDVVSEMPVTKQLIENHNLEIQND